MFITSLIAVIILICVIKTISYGIWCAKNKNTVGGISVFFLALCSALCFFILK